MAFDLYRGDAHIEWYPKKASTVFSEGDLVYADGSGAIQPADSTSGDHIGVMMKAVAATDDDYADNTSVPVLIPNGNTEFKVSVGTGTATSALVGTKFDLTDEESVDVSSTSKNVVTCTQVVSSSEVIVKINSLIQHGNVSTT